MGRNYDDISTFSLMSELLGERMDGSFMCSGITRIHIPKDATKIIEKPFTAYYYPTPKGNIGYLRIPHYSPRSENANDRALAYATRLAQYEYAIDVLEKNTVGLIIDQDHNCGGSVDYLEKILSLFMNKPFAALQFELLASKKEYLALKASFDKAPNHTISYKYWESVLKEMKEAWIAGKYLTPKVSFSNDRDYFPNSVAYTKPIIVLIDEMAGSGGDAFPALIQGYGRAKLLGTRTSGLGGHVTRGPDLVFSGISIRMTKSLFFRPDGIAVENNGAAVDIPYTITRDDVMFGFKTYQKFYTEQILKMVAQP